MAVPLSSRRGVSMALKLATIPPIALGLPLNEKDQLPCILITPSTPSHECDFQLYQFTPNPPTGLLPSVRRFFIRDAPPPIALPPSPVILPSYGYTARPAVGCWSASKRFRVFLFAIAALVFGIHLVLLPKLDVGIHQVLSAHHGAPLMDDVVAKWEEVEQPSNADPNPPTATGFEHTSTL